MRVQKRPVKGAEEANPLRFSKQGWELGEFGLESAQNSLKYPKIEAFEA